MEQPNILIIHADQHRADCLGAYGNNDIQTPNIDSLAADGVTYTESFCPFPVCTPSRYSLLTGQYVHQHLGWNNRCTLPGGMPTFPKELRKAGYHTGAVGKMHFTPTYLDVGFDEMVLAEQDGPGRFDDDYHRWLRDEGLVDRLDLVDQRKEYRESAEPEYWDTFGALKSGLDERHHSTTWIAEQAIDRLESWVDGGNLLMAGFIKPHHPFDPPAPWDAMYDPGQMSLLPGWTETPSGTDLKQSRGYFAHQELTPGKLRRVMAFYYGTISQIDFHVGRMIDLLKKKNLYDQTLIIYTSDHGDYMGYHHLLLKGNYMYDPLIKVPLIIKRPTEPTPGAHSQELISNVDIAPTILSIAGIESPGEMTGVNLAADEDSRVVRDTVFAEAYGGREYMARTQHSKLLLCSDNTASQFFDLDEDPYELVNRYDHQKYGDAVSSLKDKLAAWALFDEPSRTHLHQEAKEIFQDNGSRGSTEDYYRNRMAER